MDGHGSEHTLAMKLAQKGVTLAGPADETAGGQKIYCIPDTVIADKADRGRQAQSLQCPLRYRL